MSLADKNCAPTRKDTPKIQGAVLKAYQEEKDQAPLPGIRKWLWEQRFTSKNNEQRFTGKSWYICKTERGETFGARSIVTSHDKQGHQ